MIIYRKKIMLIIGGYNCRLWQLSFTDDHACLVESKFGMRKLYEIFKAGEGIRDLPKIIGQEIVFGEDDSGIMSGVMSAKEWDERGYPEIPEEGLHQEPDAMVISS